MRRATRSLVLALPLASLAAALGLAACSDDAAVSDTADAAPTARPTPGAGSADATVDALEPPKEDASAPGSDATAGGDAATDGSSDDAAATDDAGLDGGVRDGGSTNVIPAGEGFWLRREGRGAYRTDALEAGTRERVELYWNFAEGTPVALEGAGKAVALVTDGVATWDEMEQAGSRIVVEPGDIRGIRTFSNALRGDMFLNPRASVLGETWANGISINPRGIVTMGTASGVNEANGSLPPPSISSWRNGTLAPFHDARMDSNTAGTSRILSGRFEEGTPNARFVVEWRDMAISPDVSTPRAGRITFQMAVYSSGKVEYRYKSLDAGDGASASLQAIAHGQTATVGLATSTGDALPFSVRRASLRAPQTVTFLAADALPSTGRAIFVTSAREGDATLSLRAGEAAALERTLRVVPTYAEPVVDEAALRDITESPNVKALLFTASNDAMIPLDFDLDVFGESWRSLSVARTTAIGPYGAAQLAKVIASFDTFPSGAAPNGVIYPYAPTSSVTYCNEPPNLRAHYLVEGAAPNRKVTILWKALRTCGRTEGIPIDVEAVLHEGGTIEFFYRSTSEDPSVTGKGTLAAIENGNGDVARVVHRDQEGKIGASTHVTFARKP
jgi:hypothetical protein